MSGKVDTYEDFVRWRDETSDQQPTVGDAMRYFTATPLDMILAWWKQDREEQEAYWKSRGYEDYAE